MTPIKLINPTDEELSAAVAEHLTGAAFWAETRGEYTLAVMHDAARPPWQHWDIKEVERNKPRYRRITGQEAVRMGFFGRGAPDYATSADAVLPLLEKTKGIWEMRCDNEPTTGWHWQIDNEQLEVCGCADTLAKAICIALLRAAGHTVEMKP